MKNICFVVLFILLFPVLCGSGFLVGSGGSGGGCTQTPQISSENWELISDGEEWSNDGNWTEVPASTDYFVGDDAQYQGGSLSGLINNSAGGYFCVKSFTAITSGYVTFDVYFRFPTVAVTMTDFFVIADDTITTDSNKRIKFNTSPTGNLQITDNTTATTIATISADTWIHLEVQINIDQSDGIDAVSVWVDGVAGTGSPYDTYNRADPEGIDNVGSATDTSSTYWIDTYLHYGVERCVP